MAIKTKKSKVEKSEIFAKGLVYGFCRKFCHKLASFPSFVLLSNLRQENVFYNIPRLKSAFLSYENKKLKKSKNWDFSKGIFFLSKNWPFFHLFLLGILGQENEFNNILERQNAFLGYKNKKLKKSENWDFCKGIVYGFCPKVAIFSSFFLLVNLGQENEIYNIPRLKNAFLSYENKQLKKV